MSAMEREREARIGTAREEARPLGAAPIPIKRISWSAVFAGTLIMLVTLMLLSLLGLGIGLGTIDPVTEESPLQGLGTGALIWWVISNLIAVFIGAFVAARLTNLPFRFSGGLHGIVTWSLFALISFWIMGSAVGGVLSGVGTMVSKGVAGMGHGLSQMVATQGLPNQQEETLRQMIQRVVQQDGDAAREFGIQPLAIARQAFMEQGRLKKEVQRQDIVTAVAENSTLSRERVDQLADNIMRQYQSARQQWQQLGQTAEQTAERVSSAMSAAAIWSFVALLLGAAVAALGGSVGEPASMLPDKRVARTEKGVATTDKGVATTDKGGVAEKKG